LDADYQDEPRRISCQHSLWVQVQSTRRPATTCKRRCPPLKETIEKYRIAPTHDANGRACESIIVEESVVVPAGGGDHSPFYSRAYRRLR
jgi:hypothetical protein